MKQTPFTGSTQRGLPLEAYAFSTIGTIMLWGAIASLVAAACLSVLVGLGYWHARRTDVDERMLARDAVPSLLTVGQPTTGPHKTTPSPVRPAGASLVAG